ncbi:hypothetical protein TNIN_77181 [Trichonephila inaurata madagascariensis]|uniref:Uncharacterized protein n=1 Tax=Trichonephila inaurata madagascariensis TaxID=2747483 RepID=A0A8X7CF30_9ARAC|nr:hypothetical protein TNIN_77181 [Trichonephila inaurata madagascariensis]
MKWKNHSSAATSPGIYLQYISGQLTAALRKEMFPPSILLGQNQLLLSAPVHPGPRRGELSIQNVNIETKVVPQTLLPLYPSKESSSPSSFTPGQKEKDNGFFPQDFIFIQNCILPFRLNGFK